MEQNKKQCPYCGETIMANAKKCRYCGEWLDNTTQQQNVKKNVMSNYIKEKFDDPKPIINTSLKAEHTITAIIFGLIILFFDLNSIKEEFLLFDWLEDIPNVLFNVPMAIVEVVVWGFLYKALKNSNVIDNSVTVGIASVVVFSVMSDFASSYVLSILPMIALIATGIIFITKYKDRMKSLGIVLIAYPIISILLACIFIVAFDTEVEFEEEMCGLFSFLSSFLLDVLFYRYITKMYDESKTF